VSEPTYTAALRDLIKRATCIDVMATKLFQYLYTLLRKITSIAGYESHEEKKATGREA
jgi:hypothetical protein